MYLINLNAREKVDYGIKVIEFRDEAMDFAILSDRKDDPTRKYEKGMNGMKFTNEFANAVEAAELSEAINSMYRSSICYAYLHDVSNASFPTEHDRRAYSTPRDVQFLDKDWQHIGDRRMLSGLSSNHPCITQIISWAVDRRTSRVENRAYFLLGLLDFHRLQLEIISMLNHQSNFAWGADEDIGGTEIADDPSFFQDCAQRS
ncbi:hypothetical protein V8B97DRAFT_2105267 [Scleroderma yunnanense]